MANGMGRVGWRNYVSSVPTIWNNLTHYYSGDNTANDSKGTAHGTLVNGTLYGAAKISNGFDFDGVNDYISFPNNTFKPTGDFSISFWIYKKNNNTAGYMAFTEVGQPYYGNGMFGYNYNGGFAFEVNGGRDIVSSFIPNDTWTHIVITHKDSTNYKIYTNGVLATPVSGNYPNTVNTSVNPNFSSNNIGMTINSLNGGGYPGATKFDEIAFFDGTELTAAQVAELYNGGAGKQYTAPVATPSIITSGLVLNLDAGNTLSYSGTGTTWTDLSGNGNNGTLVNGTSYSSANGGTLVFDGINDMVSVAHSPNLNSTMVTVSMWIKFGPSLSSDKVLFSKGSEGSRTYWFYENNGVYFVYGGFTGKIPPEILVNQWCNIVGVQTSTAALIYLNGVLYSSGAGAASSTTTQGIGINSYSSGLYPASVKNISSVQIYNRALSSTEVAANFDVLKSRYGL